MKVHVQGGTVRKVSKELAAGDANGESIGMIRFSAKGRAWFAAELDRMVRNKSSLDMYYLQALQNIMDSGLPVHLSPCSPDEWAEIDFHPDLMSLRERLSQQVPWDPKD